MTSRLEPIGRWLRQKERSAVHIMAAARAQHEEAERKLAEITALRSEYQRTLGTRAGGGIRAQDLRGYHQFLTSLEAAVGVQSARLTAETQTFERATANWLEVYRKRAGVDAVVAARARSVERARDKGAARSATDRHAFRQGGHRDTPPRD